MNDAKWLLERFAECAVAWGYCQTTAKFDQADAFVADLEKLEAALRESDPKLDDHFRQLMRTHTSPWVQLTAAISLAKSAPSESLPILESLSTQDGMWALASQLHVHRLRGVAH